MIKDIERKIYLLCVKYSKKVGLNLPYFVKNGFWVTLRYFILAITGLLISISFARFGDKNLLGQYQFILSFLGIISFTSLLGLNVSALKSVSIGQDAGVIKAVNLSFMGSLAGLVIAISYGLFEIFFKGDNILGITLIISGILFPFFYATNTWYVFYEGKSMFKEDSIRVIVTNLITSLGLIFGLYLKLNYLYLVIIYLSVNIILNGIFYLEVVGKIKDKSKNFLDVKFGINSSVQKFAYSISNNLPPLAISFLLGYEILAVYYIAYYIVGTISGFLGSLSALYMPLLFKNIKLNHNKIIFQHIVIGMVFLVATLIFIRLFFIPLYGSQYVDGRGLAYIFSFLLITMPLKTFLVNFFTAKEKNSLITRTIFLANILAFVFFYLTRMFGNYISISIYMHVLQLLVIGPLLFDYLFIESKKIDSIL